MDGLGETASLLSRYDEVLAKWADPDADYDKLGEEQAELERKIEAAGAWDLKRTIEIAMDALRLPPRRRRRRPRSRAASDDAWRCAGCCSADPICCCSTSPPTTSTPSRSAWLERFLGDYHGTVVAITHDRYFLDNVARWILELDHGKGIPFEGNYSSWLEQKQERLRQQDKSDSSRQRTLERELEWVRMAPKARQAKGKARLAAYEKLLAESQAADRRRRRTRDHHPVGSAPRRCGDRGRPPVQGIRRPAAHRRPELHPPPRRHRRGDRRQRRRQDHPVPHDHRRRDTPDDGELRVGPTVELAYVDQSRDSLDAEHTVYEEITDGRDTLDIGGREVNGRAYVASFNFKGSDQQKKVAVLSGGERNRVHLAKVLKEGGNVLLLDEPTNDLDVDTLRALEDGLEAFAGCAVIISHDRWFLDRVATHVLAFEGDSLVRWFEGNFSEYEAFRHKELGAEADQPHRIKYKPLVRG